MFYNYILENLTKVNAKEKFKKAASFVMKAHKSSTLKAFTHDSSSSVNSSPRSNSNIGTYSTKEVANIIEEMVKRLILCLGDEKLKSKLELKFPNTNRASPTREISLKPKKSNR